MNPYPEYKDSGVEWIGEIPSHWLFGSMKYILSKNDGGIWGDDVEGENDGVFVIRPTEIQISGKWDLTSPMKRLISLEEKEKYKLFEGDIVVTKSSGSSLHIGKSDLPDIEKEKVFKNLLSYIVRRNICGLTTKNYNNIFNLLLKNLSKNTLSNEFNINYLKSLVGVSRWPRNEELKLTFLKQSVYPGSLELSKKVKYVLSEIEQEIRKNQRTEDLFFDTLDNLDIDHIMPRSWYQYWNLPDGSSVDHNLIYYAKQKKLIGQELNQIESDILKREAHIFTIGNLTLLNNSLNREAKHREFSHKKELIFKKYKFENKYFIIEY